MARRLIAAAILSLAPAAALAGAPPRPPDSLFRAEMQIGFRMADVIGDSDGEDMAAVMDNFDWR